MTLSFLILMLGLIAGYSTGQALVRTNPLAAYTQVWPGQPASSVAAYIHHLPGSSHALCFSGNQRLLAYYGLPVHPAQFSVSDPTDQSIFCESTPRDGVFRLMTVNIKDDYVLTLTLRSDVLQSDALYLYWGAPDAIAKADKDDQFTLTWDQETYTAVATGETSGGLVNLVTLSTKESES